MCRIRALSTNILSIVLKYLVCLPGGWEASQSLDKPVSHQHVLKNQNVFWNFKGSWYTIIVLSAFEVRSSQAAKSKSSSYPRKIPSCELWPICQALLVSKFGKRELVLTYKICLVSTAMFSRARGVKTLPGMHCDHVLLAFLELVTRWFRLFSVKDNNGQQVVIDCNIDLWSRLRWFYFISEWFVVFWTSGISGHADVWRPVRCAEGLIC